MQPPLVQLVALSEGPNILLDKPIMLFGRTDECDIQIHSRKISRRHCCIAQVSDYLVVKDLGSTNGIRINGVKVLEGKLKAGDELTIGNHRYQVRWEAHDAKSVARPAPQPPPPELDKRTVVPEPEDELLESSDEPVALPEPGEVKLRQSQPQPGTVPLEDDEDSSVDTPHPEKPKR